MKAYKMMGPILDSRNWQYVSQSYPWYVFKPKCKDEDEKGKQINSYVNVPELRYVASARYCIYDDEGRLVDKILFKPLLPKKSDYNNYM